MDYVVKRKKDSPYKNFEELEKAIEKDADAGDTKSYDIMVNIEIAKEEGYSMSAAILGMGPSNAWLDKFGLVAKKVTTSPKAWEKEHAKAGIAAIEAELRQLGEHSGDPQLVSKVRRAAEAQGIQTTTRDSLEYHEFLKEAHERMRNEGLLALDYITQGAIFKKETPQPTKELPKLQAPSAPPAKAPVVPEATLTETRGVEGAKPPTKGDFGPVFTQFKGKPQEAIEHLLRVKDGEAVSALHHKDIGEIDLVWGKEGTPGKDYKDGYGLAKIAKKHPTIINNLQEIISRMSVSKQDRNRAILESLDHRAIVRLRWNDKIKNWLLTAYETEEPPHTRGRTGVPGNKGGMPPIPRGGSKETIPPTPGEVKPTPSRDIVSEQITKAEERAEAEEAPKPSIPEAGITAESLAEKYPEASIKVKPAKEGYTGQAEYEKATYTISGKTEAEVLERLDKRLASAVPYEEAQPTRKRETEATAMTPEEMEKMAAPEEGPSGYASTGGYKRPLKGMEMPEIVKLAKEINQGEINFVVCRLVFQDNSCADLFGGSPKDYRKGTPAGPLYFFISSLVTL